jgi:hypothetical protein
MLIRQRNNIVRGIEWTDEYEASKDESRYHFVRLIEPALRICAQRGELSVRAFFHCVFDAWFWPWPEAGIPGMNREKRVSTSVYFFQLTPSHIH